MAYLPLKIKNKTLSQTWRKFAQDVALAFLQEINSETIGFEQTIQAVLESGQMPLRLVHKEQRIAFCFDRDQQMLAPFIERTETLGVDVLFHPGLSTE